MSPIKISVVIASRNRVHLLSSCLEAFSRQDFNKDLFEIIVINDGSSDGTEAFLSQFKAATNLNFQFISHENKGVSYSRNVGIGLANGRYIAFTDDDCIVPHDWLSRIAALWEAMGPSIAAIGGPLDSQPGNSIISRYIHFLDEFNYIPVLGKYWITHKHVSMLPANAPIAYARTSNAVFRAQCIKDAGGFNVTFKKPGGEDPELCYRILSLGFHFYFDKELVVLHRTRDNIRSFFGSLRNYIEGEFRIQSTIEAYASTNIRSNYFLIPCRKISSLFLSVLTAPFTVMRLLHSSQYSFLEAFFFPFVTISSKIYALCLAFYYQSRYALRKCPHSD